MKNIMEAVDNLITATNRVHHATPENRDAWIDLAKECYEAVGLTVMATLDAAWQPIETAPPFQFVWAYCKEAHETQGAASQSNGGMLVSFQPATNSTPAQFLDHFGVPMNWRFTHWRSLPAAPFNAQELDRQPQAVRSNEG